MECTLIYLMTSEGIYSTLGLNWGKRKCEYTLDVEKMGCTSYRVNFDSLCLILFSSPIIVGFECRLSGEHIVMYYILCFGSFLALVEEALKIPHSAYSCMYQAMAEDLINGTAKSLFLHHRDIELWQWPTQLDIGSSRTITMISVW